MPSKDGINLINHQIYCAYQATVYGYEMNKLFFLWSKKSDCRIGGNVFDKIFLAAGLKPAAALGTGTYS